MPLPKNDKESFYHHGWCCGSHGKSRTGFAVLLLVVGGFFLARDVGWISSDISFWPVVLVAFGLYFLARSPKK